MFDKCGEMELKGNTDEWLRSYLDNRTKCTVKNTQKCPTTGLTNPNINIHKGDFIKAANEIDVKNSSAILHYYHILLRTQCLSSQEHLPSCLMRN